MPASNPTRGLHQCTELVLGRKLGSRVGRIAIDKNEPAILGKRREQHEPALTHEDTTALGRARQSSFEVGNDEPAAVGLALQAFLHRVARHPMGATSAEDVGGRQLFRSAIGVDGHPQAGRIIFDRLHLGAVLDLDALRFQVLAQDRLGAPLGQAALKAIFAAVVGERAGCDFMKPRPDELNVFDMHACAQEWLDQACPVDALQDRRLQRGPARLVMRGRPELDDPRHDAVTDELAGREQPGWARPDDQHGRGGRGLKQFTGIQSAVLLTIDAKANKAYQPLAHPSIAYMKAEASRLSG
jgi:hypothetical protein